MGAPDDSSCPSGSRRASRSRAAGSITGIAWKARISPFAFAAARATAAEVAAELAVRRPPGHESLNVVVPWTPDRFQCNSKHAALPCEGEVRAEDRRYALDPRACFAVQDWGRGIWPYRSFWNWGVATGRVGDVLLGINFGAKWTTGTGSNENGVLWNGRLHKIMEDLSWEYDAAQWRKPWRVVAPHSGALDLVLEPVAAHTPRLNLGLLATGGVCAFGRWRGRVRVEGARARRGRAPRLGGGVRAPLVRRERGSMPGPRTARDLVTCIALALCALGCSREVASPEDRVRAVLAALEESAQEKDAGEMKEHVSEGYSDAKGNDKRAIAQLVAFHLLSNQSVYLLTRVRSVEIEEPGQARAEILVAMAGTKIEGPEALLALRADLYRFDLGFAEEDGAWRIRSAEWRPASVGDFR